MRSTTSSVSPPLGYYNTKYNNIEVKNKGDLVSAYEDICYLDNDGKEKTFIKEWLKDKRMRKYEYVKCLPPPLKCPKHTFNLWSGFAIERVERVERVPTEHDTKDFQFLLNHLLLLSNNDKDAFDFVEKWLACLFQRVGYKNNIALLFKSKQGIGKDLFFCMLENMIGDFYCSNIENAEHHVFGNFNSVLENKVVVCLNELKGAVGFKYDGRIKDMITRTHEPIRKMRTDLKDKVPSFSHYLMFSNTEFPVKVERGDRRFFVSEVKQKIPKKEYFDNLARIVKEETNWNALRMLYDHLLTIDISQVDWKKDRPMTEYMNDLMKNSQSMELNFLIEFIKDAYNGNKKQVVIPSRKLFEKYHDECLSHGFEFKMTPQKFGILVKKCDIEGFEKKRGAGNKQCYSFDVKKCIEYLVRENYISKDFVEQEPLERLGKDVKEREERKEEEDIERNQTHNLYSLRHNLPPM